MSDYEITLPDGRTIAVDAPDEAGARQAAQNFLMREGRAAEGKKGGVDNFGRALARGASFGLADEIAAAGDATVGPALDWALGHLGLGSTNTSTAPTWSQRYEQNLDGERAQDHAYDEAHPGWSTAGKIIGGVGGAVAMLPRAVLSAGPGLAGIARSGAAGAGLGALGGFGEGEGGLDQRLQSAAMGSVLGGGLGVAAMPATAALGTGARLVAESAPGRYVADKVVGPGIRMMADAVDRVAPTTRPASLSAAAPDGGAPVAADSALTRAADALRSFAPSGDQILTDAATRRIADAAGRGGADVADVGQRLTDLGPGAMLADTNPMLTRLTRTAYISPGSAPQTIDAAMIARNRATPGRFLGAMGDEVKAPSVYDAQRFLDANAREVGNTAYGAMDAAGLKQSPALMKLYENPEIERAINTVLATEKASRAGTTRAPASPVQVMHEVKRAIQDIGIDPTGKPAPGAYWWQQAADQFVAELKRANPKLAEADRAYQEAKSLYDSRSGTGWLTDGQKFMLGGTSDAAVKASPSALADKLPSATPAQALAFRVGSTNTIKDIAVAGVKATRQLADAIDSNKLLRDKLIEIYGPETADSMMRQAAAELKFASTDKAVRGGSDTAGKLLSALDDAAGGDLPTTTHGVVSRAVSKAIDLYNRGKGGNEDVRARIAQMLTETDPAANAELLDQIAKNLSMRGQPRPRAIQRGAAIGASQTE